MDIRLFVSQDENCFLRGYLDFKAWKEKSWTSLTVRQAHDFFFHALSDTETKHKILQSAMVFQKKKNRKISARVHFSLDGNH